MKTSIIYIIFLVLGILLIVPSILLKSSNIYSDDSYGVEYKLGWGYKTNIPAMDTQNIETNTLDFYEEEYELEDWMMKPDTWEMKVIKSGNNDPDSSASGLSSYPSGVSIQIIAGL